uniref:Calcineurin-like phosphoesterase domain-containing protein n=1 Tax=Dunaliella tertiolecta TaxID=3047 RepID=A0A7S3VR38_DUNTE
MPWYRQPLLRWLKARKQGGSCKFCRNDPCLFAHVQGEDMCGEPANEEVFTAYLHKAVLKINVDQSNWWYQIQGSNRVFKFKSPPKTASDSGFSFIAFGDMGQADDEHNYPGAGETVNAIAQEMRHRPVDLLIHAGDLSYASGSHHGWNHFMDSIEPFASQVPYMVSIGNYDYGYEGDGLRDPSGAGVSWFPDENDSGGECGVMSAARFSMPGARKGDKPPFWYSYNYGNVHFTVISSEHDCAPGSEQYRWLERDLSSVDRCKTPWLALVLHRPMYVVYPHEENRQIGEELRAMLEPLLLHHRVDLTIAGHVHTYFRTCAVASGECREEGITHFIAGTGGHELTSMKKGLTDSWAVEGCNDFGFLRFDVSWDSLQAQFIRTVDGRAVDEVTLRTKKGICNEWA